MGPDPKLLKSVEKLSLDKGAEWKPLPSFWSTSSGVRPEAGSQESRAPLPTLPLTSWPQASHLGLYLQLILSASGFGSLTWNIKAQIFKMASNFECPALDTLGLILRGAEHPQLAVELWVLSTNWNYFQGVSIRTPKINGHFWKLRPYPPVPPCLPLQNRVILFKYFTGLLRNLINISNPCECFG